MKSVGDLQREIALDVPLLHQSWVAAGAAGNSETAETDRSRKVLVKRRTAEEERERYVEQLQKCRTGAAIKLAHQASARAHGASLMEISDPTRRFWALRGLILGHSDSNLSTASVMLSVSAQQRDSACSRLERVLDEELYGSVLDGLLPIVCLSCTAAELLRLVHCLLASQRAAAHLANLVSTIPGLSRLVVDLVCAHFRQTRHRNKADLSYTQQSQLSFELLFQACDKEMVSAVYDRAELPNLCNENPVSGDEDLVARKWRSTKVLLAIGEKSGVEVSRSLRDRLLQLQELPVVCFELSRCICHDLFPFLDSRILLCAQVEVSNLLAGSPSLIDSTVQDSVKSYMRPAMLRSLQNFPTQAPAVHKETEGVYNHWLLASLPDASTDKVISDGLSLLRREIHMEVCEEKEMTGRIGMIRRVGRVLTVLWAIRWKRWKALSLQKLSSDELTCLNQKYSRSLLQWLSLLILSLEFISSFSEETITFHSTISAELSLVLLSLNSVLVLLCAHCSGSSSISCLRTILDLIITEIKGDREVGTIPSTVLLLKDTERNGSIGQDSYQLLQDLSTGVTAFFDAFIHLEKKHLDCYQNITSGKNHAYTAANLLHHRILVLHRCNEDLLQSVVKQLFYVRWQDFINSSAIFSPIYYLLVASDLLPEFYTKGPRGSGSADSKKFFINMLHHLLTRTTIHVTGQISEGSISSVNAICVKKALSLSVPTEFSAEQELPNDWLHCWTAVLDYCDLKQILITSNSLWVVMQKIIERSSYSVHSMLQRCVDKWIDRAANFPVLQSGGKTPSNRSPTEDLAGSGKRSRSNSIDSKGSKRLVNSRTKDLANISDSRIIEDLLDQSKDNCLRNSEDQSTKVESNLAKKEFNSPMMDSLQAWKTVSYFDNISLLQLISDCGVGTDRVREYELAGNLFLEEVEANHTACGKLKDRSQVLMEGLVLLPSAVILNHYFTSAEYHSDFLASISKRDVAKTLWSATLTSYVCIKYEEASRATQALFYRGVLSTDVLPTKRAIQAMTLLTMRVNHESLGSSSNFNEFKRENSSSQVFIPAYSQAMCSLFGSLVLSAKETGLAQFVCCQSLRTELLLSCRLMSLGKPLLNETEVLSITPKKTSCGRQTSCSIHTWRYVDWKQHMHNCLAGLAACNSAELANHTQFLLQSLLLCSKDIDSRHKTFRYLHTSRQQIPQLCFQKEEILLVQQDLFYLSEILREAHPHPAVIDQSFVQFISSAPELIHNYREIICEPLLVLRFTADALRSPTVVRVALAIFLRAMQASRIHFRQQRILGISTIKTDMKVVNSRLHVLPHVDDVLYFTVQQTMAVMLLLELCLEMQAVNSIEKPVIRLLLDAVRDLLVEESVGSAAIQLLTANQLKKGHVGALMAHEELQQLYTEQLLRDITDKSKIETCNLRIFEKNLAHCVHFLRNNHVYCNENLRLVAVNIPGYVFRVYNHFTVFHHSGVTGAVDNLVQELLELSLDQYPSMAAQLYELAIGKVALSTVHVRPITSSNSGAASQTPWFGSAVGIKRLKERIKNTINLDALHSRHSLRVYTAAAAAFLIGQSTVALEAKVDSDRNISNNQDSTATYPFNEIAKPTKKRSRKSMQDEDSDDDSISDNEKRKKTESAD